MPTLDERYEAYKTDGFTIFEKVFDEPQMQSWREKHAELSRSQRRTDMVRKHAWN